MVETVPVITREGCTLSAALMPRERAVALNVTGPAELTCLQLRLEIEDARYLRDRIDDALRLSAAPGKLA